MADVLPFIRENQGGPRPHGLAGQRGHRRAVLTAGYGLTVPSQARR